MGGEVGAGSGGEPLHESLDGMLQELLRLVQDEVLNSREVTDVIAALHAVASLLHCPSVQHCYDWPDCASLNRVQQLAVACRKKAESEHCEDEADAALRRSFYGAGLFAVLASILLHQVAPDWLACFASAAQHCYFDMFFTSARPIDALLSLVPALNTSTSKPGSDDELRATSSQAARLLVLLLVKKSGVKDIALAFADINQQRRHSSQLEEEVVASSTLDAYRAQLTKQVAQVLVSVPDRVEQHAPGELRSPLYFKTATVQLLAAAKEHWSRLSEGKGLPSEDPVFSFITETLSRLCRRGHADVVAAQMVAAFVGLGQEPLVPSTKVPDTGGIKCTFWESLAMSFGDSHAIERWVEALLREMDNQDMADVQAHSVLSSLFGDLSRPIFRSMFMEKFLLWKVFPLRCLKWMLKFAIIRAWPAPVGQAASQDIDLENEVVERIAETWSQKQFIQSVQLNQQAYITAALGICLQSMKKEQINGSGNLVSSILQGVTNRLESPIAQVRDMAARVAFVFSLAIDSKQPLWLDDCDKDRDLLDWETLLPSARNESSKGKLAPSPALPPDDTLTRRPGKAAERKSRKERKEVMDIQEDDPDAVVNYAEGGLQDWQDDDDVASLDSVTGSESSLQPYDMSDDDADLERGCYPVQLSECALSLRKGDDADAVEKALEVVNKLIRAVPDELDASSRDLAHALIHVRCSEITVEGEEESAELRRHNALVSLLVCSPFKAVDVLTRELYSAQVDISQRLLILDVMADAARELASGFPSSTASLQIGATPVSVLEGPSNPLAWYGPGNRKGPSGSGPWMDVTARTSRDSLVSWGPAYERVLPPRPGDKKLGKARSWGNRSAQLREAGWKGNVAAGPRVRFADLAAMFMLPVMRLYDRKSHGVDFVNRDFIVLARLLYMLGVCMEGIALQPEAPILGTHLVDLLRSRAISNHPEPFVRRSAIYAASRVLAALHPSQIVTAVSGGDSALTDGLEWIREWVLQIADRDADSECATMAMACLQLHSEMALEASRHSSASTSPELNFKKLNRPLLMPL